MRILLLLAGTMLVAFGQVDPALVCAANSIAVPPVLRAEGLTELVGDLVLTCTGGTPTPAGQQIPTGNISITLNTSVTSRILSNGGSEALLLSMSRSRRPIPNPCSNRARSSRAAKSSRREDRRALIWLRTGSTSSKGFKQMQIA